MSNFSKFPNYLVRKIKNHAAKELIEKYHYLHDVSSANVCYGLFKKDNKQFFGERLVGACIYGYPVGRLVCQSISPLIKQDEVLELTRLYLYDEEPKNTESFFIAQTIRRLQQDRPKIRIIVAYSDPEVKHLGTIYQASNFLYQGKNIKLAPAYWFTIHGKRMHERSVIGKYGTRYLPKLKEIDPNVKREVMSNKHRYIYIMDKRNKQEIIRTLKHPILSYPKK